MPIGPPGMRDQARRLRKSHSRSISPRVAQFSPPVLLGWVKRFLSPSTRSRRRRAGRPVLTDSDMHDSRCAQRRTFRRARALVGGDDTGAARPGFAQNALCASTRTQRTASACAARPARARARPATPRRDSADLDELNPAAGARVAALALPLAFAVLRMLCSRAEALRDKLHEVIFEAETTRRQGVRRVAPSRSSPSRPPRCTVRGRYACAFRTAELSPASIASSTRCASSPARPLVGFLLRRRDGSIVPTGSWSFVPGATTWRDPREVFRV